MLCAFLYASTVAATKPVLPWSQAEIVLSVRRYNPPGSKTKSRYRLFVAAFDGRMREVPFTQGEVYQAKWVGKQTIAWVETRPKGDCIKAWVLGSPRPVTLVPPYRDAYLESEGWSLTKRGEVFTTIGKKKFRVNGPRLEAVAMPAVDDDTQAPPMMIKLRGGTSLKAAEMAMADEVTVDGKPWVGKIEDRVSALFTNPAGILMLAFDGGGSAGSWESIYRLEGPLGQPKRILGPYSGLDVSATSTRWAGLEAGRPLSPYGRRKKVWTSKAYCGDFRTGKVVTLVDGLASTISISVRP